MIEKHFLKKGGGTGIAGVSPKSQLKLGLGLSFCPAADPQKPKRNLSQLNLHPANTRNIGWLVPGSTPGTKTSKKPKLNLLGLLEARQKPSGVFQRPWA